METKFWHEKWTKNEIGFHESKPNPSLATHFRKLQLAEGSRVFLPLCGKTLDLAWLLSQGMRVAGAELSKTAIEQLFEEFGVDPVITQCGMLLRYNANNIDIFVGDIFDLSSELLGPVDAIYDRAAMVALPNPMRKRYTRHLRDQTDNADQLLITFEYDQSEMDGPPFSIDRDEVARHYQSTYNSTLLESKPVVGGLKGICAATEHIWLLNNKE